MTKTRRVCKNTLLFNYLFRLKHLSNPNQQAIRLIPQPQNFLEGAFHKAQIEHIKRNGIFVDFSLALDEIKAQEQGMVSGIDYVMSGVDERTKYTTDLRPCLAITGVGTHKFTGKTVSFLTHQDPITLSLAPEYMRPQYKDLNLDPETFDNFFAMIVEDFRKSFFTLLKTFKATTIPGTRDVGLFGGIYMNSGYYQPEDYIKSIITISNYVREILGFFPNILAQPNFLPKEKRMSQSVFLDTQTRTTFLTRDEDQHCPISFPFGAFSAVSALLEPYVVAIEQERRRQQQEKKMTTK